MDATLFLKLNRTLRQGKGAVIVRIVGQEGSAPRGVGSACMVDEDGVLTGTIGGGLVEHRAIQKARQLIVERVSALLPFEMNAEEVTAEGMICGGRVELFFEPVFPEDAEACSVFRAVAERLSEGREALLLTRLEDGVRAGTAGNRFLLEDGNASETGNPVGWTPDRPKAPTVLEENGERYFAEPVVREPELLIFGGGHISTCLAPVAKMAGFRVKIYDDRSEFANRQRFPEADHLCAGDYSETMEGIRLGGASYVVIVTRGHSGDREVLERVLAAEGEPAYIGMIGSVRKRNALYGALLADGADQAALAAVHSPIGLDIGAQTPEEIAISIMAEVIGVKAALGGTHGTSKPLSLVKEQFKWLRVV